MSGMIDIAAPPSHPKFADQFVDISRCICVFTNRSGLRRLPAKAKGWRKHIRRQKSAVRG